MRRFIPKSFFNPISLIGAAIAGISLFLGVFIMVLDYFSGTGSSYVGIITFIILPIFLIIGLAISLAGIIREWWLRRHARGIEHHFPAINFNDPHHRTVFGFVSILTLFFLVALTFGSFQMYEYTESVEFCGLTCHSVMKPEHTAYMYSPHARVSCAECHVGTGADWYVKSKLTGAYQVYSVLFNKYNRPIETPVRNLRPAQQTCEQCHWPKHFFAEKQVEKTYFLSDEKNTSWWMNLLLKIGGGNTETGPTSGIHWHMNINNKIMYAATDSQRQIIPVIQVYEQSGKIVTYKTTDDSFKEVQLKNAEVRKMDCIDCHNRPTHIFRTPNETVNEAMKLGWISPKLPSAKAICVEALDGTYSTEQGALDSIGIFIRDQYALRYPEVNRTMKVDIDSAVEHVKKIYSRNFFPEMRVSWKNYPNNIGHFNYPGCFRCHDGKHVGDNGKVLSRDCNTCHIILAQKLNKKELHISLQGVNYEHPVDIGDAWKEMNCSDCHGIK